LPSSRAQKDIGEPAADFLEQQAQEIADYGKSRQQWIKQIDGQSKRLSEQAQEIAELKREIKSYFIHPEENDE